MGYKIWDPKARRAHRERNAAYNRRMREEGRCRACGEPAVNATHCEFHREEANRIMREYRARLKQKEQEADNGT